MTMATQRQVEITISGQDVRFEIQTEAGIYFARPNVVSQRFALPPAYYGIAKTPGKALQRSKDLVGPYLVDLVDSLRSQGA